MLVAAVVAALVLGFLIGLFSFKVKSRWCPACGSWTLRHKPAGETTVTLHERRQSVAR